MLICIIIISQQELFKLILFYKAIHNPVLPVLLCIPYIGIKTGGYYGSNQKKREYAALSC